MSLVINPIVGLGLDFSTIAWVSIVHTVSKGGLRLAVDKRFSTAELHRQALGVSATALLDLSLGVVTSLAYAAILPARLLQTLLGALGLYLLFGRAAPARARAPLSLASGERQTA